jgi:hypothetical protein
MTAMADTIRMKDGSKIKGKIVTFTGGKFVIAMGEGSRRRELTIMAGEVDSIDFDSPRDQISTITASNRTTPPVVVRQQPVNLPPPPKEEVIEEVQDDSAEQTVASNPVPAATTTTSAKKVSFAKPVELSVKVLADNTANGWTNSGWVVKKGQKIRIIGSGEVSIGRGKKTGPSGVYDLEDNEKLLKSVPTGALIAVIGDDNNEFIYIGSEREFTASRDGVLFLGLNEGNLGDNTGSFQVKIEISPDGAD